MRIKEAMMNSKITLLALLTLITGTTTPALAERGDGNRADRQQQAEQREQRPANARQGIERHTPPRTDRQSTPRIEQRAPKRVEQQRQQRVEQRNPHRTGVQIEQHKRVILPPARHIETHRSIHIERPRSTPRAYHRVARSRYYQGIRIYRTYGHRYPGFGYYYSDHDAFRWLAFTALTLSIIDQLDEQQQRMHEQAWIRATSATVGDTYYWHDGFASGSVTVLQIGINHNGREYRELRQTITAHGRSETSYAKVWQKRNGTWAISESH